MKIGEILGIAVLDNRKVSPGQENLMDIATLHIFAAIALEVGFHDESFDATLARQSLPMSFPDWYMGFVFGSFKHSKLLRSVNERYDFNGRVPQIPKLVLPLLYYRKAARRRRPPIPLELVSTGIISGRTVPSDSPYGQYQKWEREVNCELAHALEASRGKVQISLTDLML